jgi:2-deoxystreptamine N-acetyl-D-glucosaminyltransferase/2-deoxystreptamine glucosyltransferase
VRICLVTTVGRVHRIGGMQDHTRDLTLELQRLGHDVEVVSSRHPDGLAREEQEGVPWHFVDAPAHHLDRAWHRASAERVLALHAERPFDVVHSEGSAGLGLLREEEAAAIPQVVKFHGNFVTHARSGLERMAHADGPAAALKEAKGLAVLAGREHFRRGNWFRFRRCEAIVPSRQQVADTRRSHLLSPEHTHVVPNGIDASLFRPRDRAEAAAALGLSGPVVSCVGRLNAAKGFDRAIRAVGELQRTGEPCTLAIVGDGPDRARLEALADGVDVVFAGRQEPERVADYLAASDVVLFPTQHREAAPLVLLQAMACARPVIASRIGAVPEAIERPEQGVLVEPRDADALVRELRRLLADPALRERMGRAARERVEAEFTVERLARRTVAVYEIARSGP